MKPCVLTSKYYIFTQIFLIMDVLTSPVLTSTAKRTKLVVVSPKLDASKMKLLREKHMVGRKLPFGSPPSVSILDQILDEVVPPSQEEHRSSFARHMSASSISPSRGVEKTKIMAQHKRLEDNRRRRRREKLRRRRKKWLVLSARSHELIFLAYNITL